MNIFDRALMNWRSNFKIENEIPKTLPSFNNYMEYQ